MQNSTHVQLNVGETKHKSVQTYDKPVQPSTNLFSLRKSFQAIEKLVQANDKPVQANENSIHYNSGQLRSMFEVIFSGLQA